MKHHLDILIILYDAVISCGTLTITTALQQNQTNDEISLGISTAVRIGTITQRPLKRPLPSPMLARHPTQHTVPVVMLS
jgi:hypothetical protein